MQATVKFLLVDDLEDNLLALCALLRRDGVELLTARSGRQALELLLLHDVALAILDVQMPEMDGFELAELMRGSDRTRHVPLIFVTAGAHDQGRVFAGYDTGAVDFLFKPIEPHILQSKAAVFHDLFRQKQQLAQALHERTETLRLNEMFVAALGHDLRNPLNAILVAATLLQRRGDDEVVRQTGARIQASGTRMARMIGDLLDLTRTRLGGGLSLARERVDLGEVVDHVVQEHRVAWPARRIDVLKHGDLTGPWDNGRLAQAASNLVGNALQHGDAEQPVQVRLDGTQADTVALRIGNAGTIAADLLPHIFDPFRGGQPQDAPREGLGLGLYIVQQIVQAHQGQIDVRSDAVHGTEFALLLPRRDS